MGRATDGKKANGKCSKRGDGVLKVELTAVIIEKAKARFKSKATETEQLTPGSIATEHASADFCLEGAVAETLHRIKGSAETLKSS